MILRFLATILAMIIFPLISAIHSALVAVSAGKP
jgi:hypothetical protein